MGKFITTTEISSSIERIIKESQEFLILVSPFIKIHSRLQLIIEKKIKLTSVKIFIISRDNIEVETRRWLDKFDGRIKILIKSNLHAKCFLNEKVAVVTSMNLYDYSMVNNIEFGVYFEKNSNPEGFNAIYEEIKDMGIENSGFNNSKTKVSFKKLIQDFGTTNFRLDSKKNGDEVLRLYTGSEEYVPIKVDPAIKLQSKDGLERIKELIANYDVYLIRNNEGEHFKFYPKNR